MRLENISRLNLVPPGGAVIVYTDVIADIQPEVAKRSLLEVSSSP